MIAAYRYGERLLFWGGKVDDTVRELAGKARFSQHTLTEEERRAAWDAVERTAGETERRLSWWKRLAFRWLWGLG